ncbi:hypothetical protein HOLleu_29120 [Holothuria leucospilota]|uniref:Uncharacterized protein n=1 Tax=Holothuria leucospilota TaxID=206669 RepID=A0A9Q1H138_HOLLE|nr:hypothetical protein HOLleu_29120 [Holothuria leucospilota]
MLTFQSLISLSPHYLSDAFQPNKPRRALTSRGSHSLVVPGTRTVVYTDKTFLSVAAGLWNKIPNDTKDCRNLNTFKKHLKTYLFSMAYDE